MHRKVRKSPVFGKKIRLKTSKNPISYFLVKIFLLVKAENIVYNGIRMSFAKKFYGKADKNKRNRRDVKCISE